MKIGVHGRWSRRLGATVSAAIAKCLAEPPVAVIADLYDLGDPDAASMPLWLAAHRAASVLRPPVPFAVCLPTASELVVNAVEHAGTDIRVTVSHRGGGMHLAVHDGVSRLSQPRHSQPSTRTDLVTRRGTGLRVVHADADAWGAIPTRGGKIVWAAVRARPGG
ncbi:ATP-binding protein [Actinoplanes sp. NEAU-A12]|uniref:ATP-binding protein n=1 Tax=Actinoplanes sandaracinus TaxID=3045177 RepID=A0ABT6WWL3_9ACTN|nr:ATP-binding protein [Actinoplanes sandaracinus]MDI6104137.1 ATP-binding protein [Actinoplanes sandaracinus]